MTEARAAGEQGMPRPEENARSTTKSQIVTVTVTLTLIVKKIQEMARYQNHGLRNSEKSSENFVKTRN